MILNRVIPAANATGPSPLGAEGRNSHLRDRPEAAYHLRIRAGTEARTERIRDASFDTDEGSDVAAHLIAVALTATLAWGFKHKAFTYAKPTCVEDCKSEPSDQVLVGTIG